MNYEQTIDYLYRKLPMFTRVGAIAFKKDLHNTIAMCEQLGNPQNKFKTIHVGGTNGKGSTSHMLAAIFQKAGYKTGLYTSPHLKDFRERIRINGEMVSRNFVIDFVENQQQLIEEISPSFFEVTVAMAFSYFATQNIDIAIIEVGLGGRLDSTNVITPELSVITNISLDHMNILGNTLKEIASEKAGIIKPRIPVVIGESNPETDEVFTNKAKEMHSPIHFAEQHIKIISNQKKDEYQAVTIANNEKVLFENLMLDLTGTYQLKNIVTVIQSIEILKTLGFNLSNKAIYSALENVKGITGLMGRWQVLGQKPLIVSDTGHNIAGIKEVIENINSTVYNKLHIVIGMVKDKDISGVLQLLPKTATYYFCQPQLERALAAIELASEARKYGLNGGSFSTVKSALNAAKENATDQDFIFIGGSTFVVAEIP